MKNDINRVIRNTLDLTTKWQEQDYNNTVYYERVLNE